ncbi:MAG: Hsp20/alpha crystallin family protein [Prevotella sp.]|nr:Hsp20/alpha crystallin family protein [Prevotella sp.]
MLARRNNNDWMSNFFDNFFDDSWMPRTKATAPAVNVKVNDKAYVMEIAAPGLKKDYCRISINSDGNLEVKLEDKFEHKQEDRKEHYLRREFCYSNYEQTYELPDDVDRNKITAKVNDGILSIELPKKEEQKAESKQTIEVC